MSDLEASQRIAALLEKLAPYRAQIEEAKRLAPTEELRQQAAGLLGQMNDQQSRLFGELEKAAKAAAEKKRAADQARSEFPEKLAKAKEKAKQVEESFKKRMAEKKDRRIKITIDKDLHARLRVEVLDFFQKPQYAAATETSMDWHEWIGQNENETV